MATRCLAQRADRRIRIDFRDQVAGGRPKVNGAAKSSVRLSTAFIWALRMPFARKHC